MSGLDMVLFVSRDWTEPEIVWWYHSYFGQEGGISPNGGKHFLILWSFIGRYKDLECHPSSSRVSGVHVKLPHSQLPQDSADIC